MKLARTLALCLLLQAALQFNLPASIPSALPSEGPAAGAVFLCDFDGTAPKLAVTGRGECGIRDGVLYTREAGACLGPDLADYRFSFRARAPKDAEQVQIWAGFRAGNRFDRYMVGLKGGLQDDIYLMRQGYMGADQFLGVRPLDFHPVPGEWYTLKVEICSGRIRVFVGDNPVPYLDVRDPEHTLAASGPVFLGGCWIPTEYDDLRIEALPSDALDGIPVREYENKLSAAEKESLRKSQRAAYRAVGAGSLRDDRTEIPLDGKWLFLPDYQVPEHYMAADPAEDDSQWHVMDVPEFWNPKRIWLHGETMPTPSGQQHKGVSDTYYQMETARCDNYSFDWRRIKSAWYRQWIELPDDIADRRFTLVFDAVSKVADVYVNGHRIASHVGMFGEFSADATAFIHPGRNLVAVKVTKDYVKDIEDPDKVVDVAVSLPVTNRMLKDIAHGFWGDEPAGIWQPVRLDVTRDLRIEDVFIRPSLTGAAFDLTLSNAARKKSRFDVKLSINDRETGSVLYAGYLGRGCMAPSASKTAGTAASEGGSGAAEFEAHYSVDSLRPRLWSPQSPALYDFTFTLEDRGRVVDRKTICSGFRTFEVRDGLFYLNGQKYWLRGGNHIPFALAPNDSRLADTFMSYMHSAHIDVCRTHTTPWNELWMDAADRNGIGISFEGTWTWLMIQSSPIPDATLLELWREEFLSLLRKYRNHPSLLFWTVNNEMKFYDNDPDLDRAKQKMRIISDVVGQMRQIDPTRPICFDSNYRSKGMVEKFGAEFMDSVDDGDIDDVHGYYNWYDYSLFRFFNGEFQRFKMPGRPLISQEMSTGYPNNETGHPTRSYQLIHQNPMSLIGYKCYDWEDPQAFLKTQAFITGELGEALRRSNPEASGIMHFALQTWFRQCYDYRKIEPYPTYFSLKRALQPVLVSAELWGRHFYAGEKLPVRVCIVNDSDGGRALGECLLRWQIEDSCGTVLTKGAMDTAPVEHYGRLWLEPDIVLPQIASAREEVRLRLKLFENGCPLSENEYELLLATDGYPEPDRLDGMQFQALAPVPELDALGVKYTLVDGLQNANSGAVVCLCCDSGEDASSVRAFIDGGGSVLFLGTAELAKAVFPEHIRDIISPTEGDICFMERSDDSVFDGIGELELRYFNDNTRSIPLACRHTLRVNRSDSLKELAGQMKIHAYIDGSTQQDRLERIDAMRGLTLFEVRSGKGRALVSTMCTGKAATDPVAARLLANMLLSISMPESPEQSL